MLHVFPQKSGPSLGDPSKFKPVPRRECFLFSDPRAGTRPGHSGFNRELRGTSRKSKRQLNQSSDRVGGMILDKDAGLTQIPGAKHFGFPVYGIVDQETGRDPSRTS